jgi:hypothetical protein
MSIKVWPEPALQSALVLICLVLAAALLPELLALVVQ